METPCWLGTDMHSTLLACELRDMSEGGAQIGLPFPAPLPEQVALYFTEDRDVVRKSRVVWRDGTVVGLMFLDRDKAASAVTGPRPPWSR